MQPMTTPDLELHTATSPRYSLECTPCSNPDCLDHDTSTPADEVILQIGCTRTASSSQVEAWLHHADDRVVLEVLRLKRFRGTATEHAPALLDRALNHARAIGMLWTPLLDTLTEYIGLQRHPVLERWRSILIAELHRVGNADDVHRLLSFRSSFLLGGIAHFAPNIRSEHVWRLCKRGFAEELSGNPFLFEEAAASLVNYLIDQFILIGGGLFLDDYQRMERCIECLDRLSRQGFPIPPNRVSRIAKRLPRLKRGLRGEYYAILEDLVLRSLRTTLSAMTPRQRTDAVGLLLSANEGDRVRALLSI